MYIQVPAFGILCVVLREDYKVEQEKTQDEFPSEMTETQLGPVGAGLSPIPEPSGWDSAYGIDEAAAIAVVPERALIFWELARIIEASGADDVEFRLIRLLLEGELPKRERFWSVRPIGRFQDSGLVPGKEYIYVLARVVDGEETPLMVTNPIRMPLKRAPLEIPGELPSSIDLTHWPFRRALKEED